MSSKWPREGLTIDPVLHAIKNTVLNPALSIPLALLGRYTAQGGSVARDHSRLFRALEVVSALGLWIWGSDYLGRGVVNNWTRDTYDWRKEIVVVTGGSDGIGAEIVHLLAQKGVKVIVFDIQPLHYEAPPGVSYFLCDLRSRQSLREAAAQARAAIGVPTVVINNAGVAPGKDILDLSEAQIRLTFDVNTLAHYWTAHEFLPDIIRGNHGMVVTVASVAAYHTAPGMVEYAASKAAATALHEGIACELTTRYNAPKVRTVLVTPGHVNTRLFTGWDSGNIGFLLPSLHPKTIAEAVVKQVLSGRSGHVVVPSLGSLLPFVRTWPLWLQYPYRNRGKQLMLGVEGRQVIDAGEKSA